MMKRAPVTLRLFAYALATNAVWEFVQCVVFYDMWSWNFWRAALWMAGATLADGVLVLGIVALASGVFGCRVWPPNARGWAVLICIGLLVGVAVEWIAQSLALWKYGSLMPGLDLFGQSLGVIPLMQMALLSGLSVWLAAQHKG